MAEIEHDLRDELTALNSVREAHGFPPVSRETEVDTDTISTQEIYAVYMSDGDPYYGHEECIGMFSTRELATIYCEAHVANSNAVNGTCDRALLHQVKEGKWRAPDGVYLVMRAEVLDSEVSGQEGTRFNPFRSARE